MIFRFTLRDGLDSYFMAIDDTRAAAAGWALPRPAPVLLFRHARLPLRRPIGPPLLSFDARNASRQLSADGRMTLPAICYTYCGDDAHSMGEDIFARAFSRAGYTPSLTGRPRRESISPAW